MKEIALGMRGIEHLAAVLLSNPENSLRSSLSKLPLSQGITMTWVPNVLQSPEFSFQGLGLDYDEDLWMPFREKIREYSQQTPLNVVFTQTFPVENDATTEWFNGSPSGLKRFAVHCLDAQSVQASWEHYSGFQAEVSEEQIESLINEAFPFPSYMSLHLSLANRGYLIG